MWPDFLAFALFLSTCIYYTSMIFFAFVLFLSTWIGSIDCNFLKAKSRMIWWLKLYGCDRKTQEDLEEK